MKILSIDVGIKNLSYCYLDLNVNVNIIKWENLCVTNPTENCKKLGIETITELVLQVLNDNFNESFEANIVLIENQPMLKNGLMKTISVIIYTYFNMMRLQFANISEVKFISAMNKLKCKKGIDLKIDTYKDRKKASIDLTKIYINAYFPDQMNWFNMQKKQDDYSDCMLQAIYYIEKVLQLL
jgi:hypothetical protein